MAITVFAVNAVTGEPEYDGREIRGSLSPMWFGKTAAKPLGARSGVAHGTPTDTISVSGTTVTISAHAGVLDLQAALEASVYLYVNNADTTLTHDAAHATNARKDLICALLDDPAESDGSTVPAVTFTITKGAEDGSNVAPATPARSMPLAHVNVPASGGGASTITWVAPYAVAAGGIIPVRDTTERDALAVAYPPTTDAPLVVWLKSVARFQANSGSGWADFVAGYHWADAAARAAQTGMATGELGLQADTGITYRYSGAAWVAWDSGWITDTMTTSITVGTGGSTVLKHKYTGGLVEVKGAIILGTSEFAIGANATMNLPVTVETPPSPYFAYKGSANMYDSNVPANYDLAVGASNLSTTVVAFFTLASAIGLRAGVGTSTPIAWAANDVLSFHFTVTPA